MRLFDDIIGELRELVGNEQARGRTKALPIHAGTNWPPAGNRNIILQSEVGVELGNPRDESVSFLAWTEQPSLVRGNAIFLIGPDLGEAETERLPFGKVVLVRVSGFDEGNAYERHNEMERSRFELSLEGYMIRAASQHLREWSRVSKEALQRGFSLSVLGSEQIHRLEKLPYVVSTEVLFVTASSEEVARLRPHAEWVSRYIGAMKKMSEELDLDCSSCDYRQVCSEVDDLRAMRASLQGKARAGR